MERKQETQCHAVRVSEWTRTHYVMIYELNLQLQLFAPSLSDTSNLGLLVDSRSLKETLSVAR